MGALGARGPSARAGNDTSAAPSPGAPGRHGPLFAPTDTVLLPESVPLPFLLQLRRGLHIPVPSGLQRQRRPRTALLPPCCRFRRLQGRLCCRHRAHASANAAAGHCRGWGREGGRWGRPVAQLQATSADTGCASCYFCPLFPVGITTSGFPPPCLQAVLLAVEKLGMPGNAWECLR